MADCAKPYRIGVSGSNALRDGALLFWKNMLENYKEQWDKMSTFKKYVPLPYFINFIAILMNKCSIKTMGQN